MQTNNEFTKIKYSRIAIVIMMAAVLLVVSGCGNASGTIDSETPGVFNHYIIYPISAAIQYLAEMINGNFGISIILITLLVRLVLLPLMLRQYRSQQRMKTKLQLLQPELSALQDKYKDKTDEASKAKQQQEMLQLYQKHQFNPLAIGCLPMLLQLPILTGLYWAIRLTPEMADHSFLWFQLGKPDWMLPIIAAAVYLLQFKVTQRQQQGTVGSSNEAQQKQMAMLGYFMPIMMVIFAMTAPAAISLYWVVGGLFVVVQTYIFQHVMNRKSQ